MMNKNKIIQILGQYKKDFADKYGIIRMGIFGSLARNNAEDESDIDVFVDMVKPDLFTIAGIKNDLETKLNNSVDLIPYGRYMNISLKQRIDRDAFDV
jgi:uncharacterized protein